MMKDPEQALLNLITTAEQVVATLPKSKERAALTKASYEARQHLRIPHINPIEAAKIATITASQRAQDLRDAAAKYLTHPIDEVDIKLMTDRTYGERDNKVVDLFPKKVEDPIARAVRISQQLRRT